MLDWKGNSFQTDSSLCKSSEPASKPVPLMTLDILMWKLEQGRFFLTYVSRLPNRHEGSTASPGIWTDRFNGGKNPLPPLLTQPVLACLSASFLLLLVVSARTMGSACASTPYPTPGLNKPDNILTHTDRSLSRPVVVLLADPHRHPNEAEARVALVHYAASVVVVLTIDLPIDNGVRQAAVPSWMRQTRKAIQSCLLACASGITGGLAIPAYRTWPQIYQGQCSHWWPHALRPGLWASPIPL